MFSLLLLLGGVFCLRDSTCLNLEQLRRFIVYDKCTYELFHNTTFLQQDWASCEVDIDKLPKSIDIDDLNTCYNVRLEQTVTNLQYSLLRHLFEICGGNVKRKHASSIKAITVCFDKGTFPVKLVSELSCVKYVEKDARLSISQLQKNPPWGLWRLSRNNGNIGSGYSFDSTGSGVNIYILDSGVNSYHPGNFIV